MFELSIEMSIIFAYQKRLRLAQENVSLQLLVHCVEFTRLKISGTTFR